MRVSLVLFLAAICALSHATKALEASSKWKGRNSFHIPVTIDKCPPIDSGKNKDKFQITKYCSDNGKYTVQLNYTEDPISAVRAKTLSINVAAGSELNDGKPCRFEAEWKGYSVGPNITMLFTSKASTCDVVTFNAIVETGYYKSTINIVGFNGTIPSERTRLRVNRNTAVGGINVMFNEVYDVTAKLAAQYSYDGTPGSVFSNAIPVQFAAIPVVDSSDSDFTTKKQQPNTENFDFLVFDFASSELAAAMNATINNGTLKYAASSSFVSTPAIPASMPGKGFSKVELYGDGAWCPIDLSTLQPAPSPMPTNQVKSQWDCQDEDIVSKVGRMAVLVHDDTMNFTILTYDMPTCSIMTKYNYNKSKQWITIEPANFSACPYTIISGEPHSSDSTGDLNFNGFYGGFPESENVLAKYSAFVVPDAMSVQDVKVAIANQMGITKKDMILAHDGINNINGKEKRVVLIAFSSESYASQAIAIAKAGQILDIQQA